MVLEKKDDDEAIRLEMSRFSGRLAHDVKNSLGVIVSGIGYLRAVLPKDNCDITETLDLTKEATQRIDQLMESILRFSRPSEPKSSALDLAETLNNIADFCREKILRQGMVIKVECPAGIRINADPNQMRDALSILLENAQEAVKDNGEITIKGYSSSGSAVIEVVDKGEGISPADLSEVFKPLFTTRKQRRACGMGLSIARAIVGKHGGEISIESALQKGTIVKIGLPL